MKKIVSLLLALVMLLAATAAFAEGAEEAPAIKLEKDPLPGPSYCSDKLVFHEDHWDVPPEDKDLFNSMAARFYNNLYDALTTGAALAIPPEQVLQQIAVIEECHKQNPLPKKY